MPSRNFALLSARLARWATPALVGWFGLAMAAGGALTGYLLTERAGRNQQAAVASERLELYASTLESELARYAHLPGLIAIEPEVAALFSPVGDEAQVREARAAASRRLARVNARAGSIVIAVLDAGGHVLASSQTRSGELSAGWPVELVEVLNLGAPGFFAPSANSVGTDYYFVQPLRWPSRAHKSAPTRQGTVAPEPKAGAAAPTAARLRSDIPPMRDERLAGRVVVKLSLAPLEATWVDLGLRTESEKLLVVDDREQVIMTSVPAWKRRALLWQAGGELPSLPLPGDAEVLRVVARGPRPTPATAVVVRGVGEVQTPGEMLAQEREIVPLAVRLLTFSDLSEVRRTARFAAWGGGLGGAFLGVLVLYLLQRRRAMEQLFQARNALQRAHDELERQVDERTHQLLSANAELKTQIAQRLQAEDELMQASKLAVLGQMSAGISHEINQPLTALRALSRNTVLLLEAGRTVAVADNLHAIDDMVARMGRIVVQLKSFARKSGGGGGPVPVALAVRNVLMLLEHRWQSAAVELDQEVPEDLAVQGDLNRLEQVLVNLVGNALDAMATLPVGRQRRLGLRARAEGNLVRLSVSDSGPGLSDADMQRLFEPFFTTKAAGQGLGLGLVISSKIVREMGGQLRARRGEGGLVLEVELPASRPVAGASP